MCVRPMEAYELSPRFTMSIFVTEITIEIGMKIDRGWFTQTKITTEINKACFTMTISLMNSVVNFLDWNRQSMFHDVDCRVRVTEIDRFINIIANWSHGSTSKGRNQKAEKQKAQIKRPKNWKAEKSEGRKSKGRKSKGRKIKVRNIFNITLVS